MIGCGLMINGIAGRSVKSFCEQDGQIDGDKQVNDRGKGLKHAVPNTNSYAESSDHDDCQTT